jgi:TonB family protein
VENSNTDILLIRKYLQGQLDERAMYQLERRAQEDPALMDLMIGMESGTVAEDEINLHHIHQLISERVTKGHTKKLYPYRNWAVAASMLLCASIAAFLFFKQPGQPVSNKGVVNAPQIVSKKSPQAPVVLQKPAATPSAIKPAALENMIASNRSVQTVKAKNNIINPAQVVIDAERINPAAAKARVAVASAALLPQNDSVYQASGDLAEIAVAGYPVQHKKEIAESKIMVRGLNTIQETSLQGRIAGMSIGQDKAADSRSFKISGIVTDADGKTPLPGAAVKLKGSSTGTSTDQNGQFSLEASGKEQMLQVNMIGYQSGSALIGNSPDSNLNIMLQPSTEALNEIVVVGYGKASKPGNKPEPVIGWASYKLYLKQSTSKYQQRAKVRLEFNINTYGQPGNFKVIKSSGNNIIDSYAIQIIEKGSKWTIGISNNHTVKLQLSFN